MNLGTSLAALPLTYLEISIEFAKALDFVDEEEHFDPLALPGQKKRKIVSNATMAH
jgi:hypothetical protein